MIRHFAEYDLELERRRAGFYVTVPDGERAIIRTESGGPPASAVLWELATGDGEGWVLDGLGGWPTLRDAAFELGLERWVAPVELEFCSMEDRRRLRDEFRARAT